MIIVEQVLESPCAFCSSKVTASAELIGQGILEALGRCVKRYVLHELADTDIVRFCLLCTDAVTSMLPTAVAARIVDTSFFFIKRSLLVKFIYLKT